MTRQKAPLSIISCDSGLNFAKKVVRKLKKISEDDVHLIDSSEVRFANTEIKTVINESIRGKDVFIIQDVENHTNGMSVDDNLRALYTTVDACRRCDAERITAVIPSFPYARQDKQDGREGISASRIAYELEGDCGVDHIITIDLHNSAIQGFFRRAKIDNLKGGYVLIPYLKRIIKNTRNSIIMPTDLGGAKRANYFAQQLHTDIAFSYKTRNYCRPNSVEKISIMGDIKGKDIYIVDDMICTGGTLSRAIEEADKMGVKSITAVCTLSLLNGPAKERFEKAYTEGMLKMVIGTDATYQDEEFVKNCKWFKQLSVANYFADTIDRINRRDSITDLL
jgi:ribose-phosphate pyrophosphokinase